MISYKIVLNNFVDIFINFIDVLRLINFTKIDKNGNLCYNVRVFNKGVFMDLNKKLINNSCKEKVNAKKVELLKIKKIISDIKKSRKQLVKQTKEDKQKQEKQNRNTVIFFNNFFGYMKDAVCNGVSGYACCYKTSYCEGSEIYNIDPIFWPGMINLELLHSLCYKKGIILIIIYDDEENNAYMYFEVSPTTILEELEYEQLKLSNLQNMNMYHQYLVNTDVELYDKSKVKKTEK